MPEKKVDFDFHNCPACGSGMINLDGDSPGQETYSCGECRAKWVQNYVYTDAYLIEEAIALPEEDSKQQREATIQEENRQIGEELEDLAAADHAGDPEP